MADETCATCGHRHTPSGCTGDPTPSDLWAGVSPATCDCDDEPTPTVREAGDEGIAAVGERLVRGRLAFYGYTTDQIDRAHAPLDHRAAGCELVSGVGWDCANERGVSNHPDHDEADETAEFVMWVLEHPALAPLIAERERAAEQRGREDNADHGMCYVHGSKALEARERAAGERALEDAAKLRELAAASIQTIARVRALADEWERRGLLQQAIGNTPEDARTGGLIVHMGDRLRAALAPESDEGDA